MEIEELQERYFAARQKGIDKKRSFVTICCVVLFIISLFPRLLYNNNVLNQFAKLPHEDQPEMGDLRRQIAQIGKERSVGYLTPDSPDYLEPAAKLLKGSFAEAISVKRPVGYPAFLSLTKLQPTAILTAQAILLTLIPVCTFLLALLLTQNVALSFAAGLISCLSPTGIALGALVLADGLFSALFAISFVFLFHGALCRSFLSVLLSAIFTGLAVMVKPMLLFWPLISVFIYSLIAGSQELLQGGLRDKVHAWLQVHTRLWRHVTVLLFIPLFFITSWAALNYWRNGVFTFSNIGALTMREYLAVQIEGSEIAGKGLNNEAMFQRQIAIRKRFRDIPTEEEKLRTYKSESMLVFRKHPLRSVQVMMENGLANYMAGWNSFGVQLPYSQQEFLKNVSIWEYRMHKLVFLPMIVAPIIGFIIMKIRPSHQNGRLAISLFAMTLTFLFFFVCSGITFWTGPRIIYPAEFVLISSMAILLVTVARTTKALMLSLRVASRTAWQKRS